jgi:CheY-like chemotaxis protein
MPGEAAIRVLVVDDERDIVDFVERSLRQSYDCVGLTSAQQAMVLLEKEEFDVVLTDQRLRDGTGTALLAHAAQVCPLACRIAMSGDVQHGDLMAAINVARVSHYLTKPLKRETLLTAIGEALAVRKSEQEAVSRKLGLRTPHARRRPEGWPETPVEELAPADSARLARFLHSELDVGCAVLQPGAPEPDADWYAEVELNVVTSLRETDHCFRVGGHGFIVLFGHTSKRGSELACKRLREVLRSEIDMHLAHWPEEACDASEDAFACDLLARFGARQR